MAGQGMSIAEAAVSLGVSPRTVRRFIKSGKVRAELVPGQFGQEYRIFDLPQKIERPQSADKTPGQTTVQTHIQAMDIIRELQEKNLALAARLGAATERIKNLEGQVKLLGTARQPWWKRIFSKRGQSS